MVSEKSIRRRSAVKIRLRRWARSIVHARGTPEAVAVGVAVGLFVAMTPTLGFQMIIAAFLTTIVGASRVPAILVVWITNPLTAVPVYGFCYQVGAGFLRHWFKIHAPGWAVASSRFAALFHCTGVKEMWRDFLDMLHVSAQLAAPLWTGCILVGLLTGLVSYPVVLRLVKGHRLMQAQKRAKRLERRWSSRDKERA